VKIGIHTWGSEGDVRPFAALAHGLAKRGHEVTLAYAAVDRRDYSTLAQRGGFRAVAVGARYFTEVQATLEAGMKELGELRNPLKQMRKILELLLFPVADEMYRTSVELCAETDAEVVHFIHHPGMTASRRAGRPLAAVFTLPGVATRDHAPIGAPELGRFINPLLWKVTGAFFDSIVKAQVNRLRSQAGVPLLRRTFEDGMDDVRLSLTAVSPTLYPRPADWEPRDQVCGFLGVTENLEGWEPPPALTEALQREPQPVYFTFGSVMAVNRQQALESLQLMAEAARLARVGAIIQVPAELRGEVQASEGVLFVDRAPHFCVFPQCAAVVHHGGAGTTQAATAAGCPSIVVAHGVDQYFWGKLLQRRGLAPAYLDRRSATPAKLAARIRQVIDRPQMKETAEKLGAAIRGEDGVARAVQLIEEKLL
jgi:UDP:flavonoid glycosyltransferase YjiC (YdhE family)